MYNLCTIFGDVRFCKEGRGNGEQTAMPYDHKLFIKALPEVFVHPIKQTITNYSVDYEVDGDSYKSRVRGQQWRCSPIPTIDFWVISSRKTSPTYIKINDVLIGVWRLCCDYLFNAFFWFAHHREECPYRILSTLCSAGLLCGSRVDRKRKTYKEYDTLYDITIFTNHLYTKHFCRKYALNTYKSMQRYSFFLIYATVGYESPWQPHQNGVRVRWFCVKSY